LLNLSSSFFLPPFCFFPPFCLSVQYSPFIFLVFFSVALKTMSVTLCKASISFSGPESHFCMTLSGSTNHLFNTLQIISFCGPESVFCMTLSGSTNYLCNTLQIISFSGPESDFCMTLGGSTNPLFNT
jgi:hypothetical protein